VTVLIFQLHGNIAPELIILGKYHYHRNFNPLGQSQLLKLYSDILSLHRQISLKLFKSSFGGSWSEFIGMQYLRNKSCKFATVNAEHTKSHAIYPPIASPKTYGEQTLAQHSVHLLHRRQIHVTRGKHNRHASRR
jgi:hypothetical protein